MFRPKQLLFSLTAILAVSIATAADQEVQNPLVFGNTRITFVTPTLFRVEYAQQGAFVDQQTMFAHERGNLLPASEITISSLGDNRYDIRTDAVRLKFHNDGYPCGTFNLEVYYMLGGEEKKLKSRGNKHNNLGGAISTLDRVKGDVPTDEGLLSRDGWYIIDDTGSDLVVDGNLTTRPATHISDQYYFVYGNDYKAALASLGAIGGKVPMTRKYMHGLWYCRYWDYTAEEFLDIIRGYDEHDFPIDNIVFDMGWHTKDAAVGAGDAITRSWTGYTWDKSYIPDPKALIDEVHRRGITVSLNDHPHDGMRPHEQGFGEFFANIKRDAPDIVSVDSAVVINYGNKVYMKNFFEYAHRPSDRLGVDFWWLDWQQNYLYPNIFGTKTTTLAWLNKCYYEDSERDGKRGANYSRWAGWGDHRYPIHFSGDAFTSWAVLAFEIKLTMSSSNAGCFYWAHDIGGFYGSQDPELFARWHQFGALSASLKVHAMKDPKLDRRPWIWGEMAEQSVRKAHHLRSELFPYIYSTVWNTHCTMTPMIRSMYIDYPMLDAAYKNQQEYMFGDLLLVAPITSAGEGEQKIATQRVWFPNGDIWYDWFSSEAHDGGTTDEVAKSIDEFPLFVKGGYLLPMQPYSPRPATVPLSTLVLRCYPSSADVADNSYTLYEDDGISEEYEQGKYATTDLRYSRSGYVTTLTITATQGNYTGQLSERGYRIDLGGVDTIRKVRVNGKSVKPTRDDAIKGYSIVIPSQSIRRDIIITIE